MKNLIKAAPQPIDTIHNHNYILCCPFLLTTGHYGRPSYPHIPPITLPTQSATMPNVQTMFPPKNPTYLLLHLRTRLQSPTPPRQPSPNHRASPRMVSTSRRLLNPLRNAPTITTPSQAPHTQLSRPKRTRCPIPCIRHLSRARFQHRQLSGL